MFTDQTPLVLPEFLKLILTMNVSPGFFSTTPLSQAEQVKPEFFEFPVVKLSTITMLTISNVMMGFFFMLLSPNIIK
jgi:hypothetical protein